MTWQLIGSKIYTLGNDRERRLIAETHPAGAFGMDEQQEAEANLIAAAPDLLAALERCADLLADYEAELHDPKSMARRDAEAAIARAKGEIKS